MRRIESRFPRNAGSSGAPAGNAITPSRSPAWIERQADLAQFEDVAVDGAEAGRIGRGKLDPR